jgi:pimeloyl-ACP methyl ester carboxylesterase
LSVAVASDIRCVGFGKEGEEKICLVGTPACQGDRPIARPQHPDVSGTRGRPEGTPLPDGVRAPAFFSRLATADRWRVVLPGADHAAHLETPVPFVNAVLGFLGRHEQ